MRETWRRAWDEIEAFYATDPDAFDRRCPDCGVAAGELCRLLSPGDRQGHVNPFPHCGRIVLWRNPVDVGPCWAILPIGKYLAASGAGIQLSLA
jgi:hypothetical protein